MTNVPEIDAENQYQKTGTINRHENRASFSYSLPKTGKRKIWYQIAHQTRQKPVPAFWYRLLALISGKCAMGITFDHTNGSFSRHLFHVIQHNSQSVAALLTMWHPTIYSDLLRSFHKLFTL